ncbi:unnamed protein product [Rangifer tarandus platyrhynchus]|uniref:Uncharacterized protein n=1 Tax=Rangifer tarandus platyrhynchus TaxID=3082113 RepID=A0AC59Z871_RANTA
MEKTSVESYPKDKAKGSWVALLLPLGPHQVKWGGPNKYLERSRSSMSLGDDDDDDNGNRYDNRDDEGGDDGDDDNGNRWGEEKKEVLLESTQYSMSPDLRVAQTSIQARLGQGDSAAPPDGTCAAHVSPCGVPRARRPGEEGVGSGRAGRAPGGGGRGWGFRRRRRARKPWREGCHLTGSERLGSPANPPRDPGGSPAAGAVCVSLAPRARARGAPDCGARAAAGGAEGRGQAAGPAAIGRAQHPGRGAGRRRVGALAEAEAGAGLRDWLIPCRGEGEREPLDGSRENRSQRRRKASRPKLGFCRLDRHPEPGLRSLFGGTIDLALREEEERPPPGAGKREEPGPRRKFASSGGQRGRSGRRSLFKANSELRNLRAAFKAPSHTRAQQSALLLLQPLASPRREKEHTLGARGAAELRSRLSRAGTLHPTDPLWSGRSRWHRQSGG